MYRRLLQGFGGLLLGLILAAPGPRLAQAQAIDIVFVVDLSGSFADDLPTFKAQGLPIMNGVRAAFPDSRFALTSYKDYRIAPYGGFGDYAHLLHSDFTFDINAINALIQGFSASGGSDFRESQLPALFQAATGAGHDINNDGDFLDPGEIMPGQNVNFRPGIIKLFLLWTDALFHYGCGTTIPTALPCEPAYPGPSCEETVAAILALDPPLVLGLSSGGGGTSDLELIAEATDALAPEGGVDCNDDGTIDIPEGEPLVCTIGSNAAGITEAIIALVEGAAGMSPRALKQMAIDDLNLLLPTGDKKRDKKILKVIERIEDSLEEDRWIDDAHLVAKKGKKVFDDEKKAVHELEKLIKDTEGEFAEYLTAVKNKLLDADAALARTALDEAQAACDADADDEEREKCQKEVDKGEEEMAKAEAEREDGDCDKAISKYKKAWEKAQKAMKKLSDDEGEEEEEEEEEGGEDEEPVPSKGFEGPVTFALGQNFPNPFNPSTTIDFTLPEAVYVRLEVFDVLGRRVALLVDGTLAEGRHEARFDAGDLPSGIYLYRITAGRYTEARQMLLTK